MEDGSVTHFLLLLNYFKNLNYGYLLTCPFTQNTAFKGSSHYYALGCLPQFLLFYVIYKKR